MVPPPDPVTVVVVHWNQLRGCLRTVDLLLGQTVPISVTVVDNGSDAGAVQILRERLSSDVTLVELGGNTGFGPGANAGLRRWLDDGLGTWAVVAPHDALIGPDTIERLICEIDGSEGIGLASADVGDGCTPHIDPYLGAIPAPATRESGFEDADYAHGTLLAVRRECAADIGLFDERYFAYCEEADLGIRARAAGWRVGVVRGVGVSNPEMGPGAAWIDYLQLRNTLLLLREHFGRRSFAVRFGVAVVQIAGGFVRPGRRSAFFSARARVLALRDASLGRYGPPPAALTAD